MPYLPGTHLPGRWREIAEAGRALSREWRSLGEADWMRRRVDPWTQADHVAWQEAPVPRFAPDWLHRLAAGREAIEGPATLVHGDLSGNVLFEPGQPPAIIDLSMYVRPVEFATAVVVVDAVCFENAPATIRGIMASDAQQLILRAVLFRALTDLLRTGTASRHRYEPALRLIEVRR